MSWGSLKSHSWQELCTIAPWGLLTLCPLDVHGVLVHSGCYNRVPSTGKFISHRNLFCTIPEAGKSKIKQIWGPVRTFQVHRLTFSPYVLTGGTMSRTAVWVPFIRALIPLMKAPPSWPHHLPKASPSKAITLVTRFQCKNLGEQEHSGHSTWRLSPRMQGWQGGSEPWRGGRHRAEPTRCAHVFPLAHSSQA